MPHLSQIRRLAPPRTAIAPNVTVPLPAGLRSLHQRARSGNASGKQVYRQRLGGSLGYTASPVAADGKLYFTGEDGAVRVVRAGLKYELLATNQVGDTCMAIPAIANGMIFVRTQRHLVGIGRKAK
jgi:hypothetical protein